MERVEVNDYHAEKFASTAHNAHIAGSVINIGGEIRQLCSWCGNVIVHYFLEDDYAPVVSTGAIVETGFAGPGSFHVLSDSIEQADFDATSKLCTSSQEIEGEFLGTSEQVDQLISKLPTEIKHIVRLWYRRRMQDIMVDYRECVVMATRLVELCNK